MGLVATAVGLVAQTFNRRGWYLAAGMGASLTAILFAMLVPLDDRTNSLPAVLRSNYWLILHVLTIVASYGGLLLAAVLGHVYLVRNVLLRRPDNAPTSRVIVQVYRTMQLGLVLLTVGTILGGVWAADSWGRFWGWDPKGDMVAHQHHHLLRAPARPLRRLAARHRPGRRLHCRLPRHRLDVLRGQLRHGLGPAQLRLRLRRRNLRRGLGVGRGALRRRVPRPRQDRTPPPRPPTPNPPTRPASPSRRNK
jgi:hypothetical protein